MGGGWHGFAVTSVAPPETLRGLVAATPIAGGWQVELAGAAPCDGSALASELIASARGTGEPLVLSYADAEAGVYRAVAFLDDRMTGALLVAPKPIAEGRDWLVARLGTPLGPTERFRLLDGRPGGAMQSRGPTVCFCCDVAQNEIAAAIAAGSTSVAAIGLATRAGTNCGRCHPDIALLIG